MSANKPHIETDASEELQAAQDGLKHAGWHVERTPFGILCSRPVGALPSGKTITDRWLTNGAYPARPESTPQKEKRQP